MSSVMVLHQHTNNFGDDVAGSALVLGLVFLALSARVGLRVATEDDAMKPERQMFAWSVIYLFALFAALVADRLIIV